MCGAEHDVPAARDGLLERPEAMDPTHLAGVDGGLDVDRGDLTSEFVEQYRGLCVIAASPLRVGWPSRRRIGTWIGTKS